jgi:glutamyl-tRNA synthetase
LKNIVRFAPSPTGYLHIGGARTAIFNWLIARKTGGTFLLRIEDTDFNRSTQESVTQILDSLQWLGIDYDDKLYFQSKHKKRHSEIVNQLLNSGCAYRCFCSKEELEEKKQQAIKEKRNLFYDKSCRSLNEDQIQEKLSKKIPYAVRFKTPEGITEYNDLIHGKTSVRNDTIEDFIILRSDGTPVYQIAVVVDDHDMGVNLVMRGDDHISNTPKQILLYKALNWEIPKFAHIPLILGADKVRLSKRHGATSIEEFRNQGILPEALFNYLCLLGWAPGDDSEILSRDEILQKFSIEKINNRPAVFDFKKLRWMNSKYFALLPKEEINTYVSKWLADNHLIIKENERNSFDLLVSLQQSRAESAKDFTDSLWLFFMDPREYDEKGIKKYFNKEGADNLLKTLLAGYLHKEEAYFNDLELLESDLRALSEENNVSAAKIIHPLRLALTGKTASPGIFEIISILGKEKVIRRIEKAINFILAQNRRENIEA